MVTSARPIVLRVDDLHKAYGELHAVAGASFALHEGTCLALLGPNGAGKTTLIRCIAGRAKPDRGTISLRDEILAPNTPRHNLGIVPQEIAVYDKLSIRENLATFARLHGVSAEELPARITWALDWIGLTDRQTSLVGTLSGGMKRRVNIACGVMHQPKIIILDEPTVGVDPQSRERIYDMLATLRNDGVSIVLTTHQLEEAETRCDQIVVMDAGKVIATGNLDELVRTTVGSARRVAFSLADRLSDHHATKLTFDPRSGKYITHIEQLGRDLPGIIAQLEALGQTILDVEVRQPSLQAVFLHLTGKDLRE